MWSSTLLPLLPGPLCHGVVVPFRVPFMSQIDLFKNDSYSTGIPETILLNYLY